MDEFKSFDLKTKKDSIFNIKKEEKKPFKSELGDFTHLQEQIIMFGRSKGMLFLTILIVVGFILSLISLSIYLITDLTFVIDGVSRSINWIKIFIVIALGIAALPPLAAVLITYGCRKLKVKSILSGLSFVDLLLTINYIILIIVAIAVFIKFLGLLFSSFIIVLFIGAIIVGFFYLYFRFLARALEFSHDVSSAFSLETSESKIYPEATSLRPFLIFIMILSIINWLSNLGDSNVILDQLNVGIANIFEKLGVISHISFLLSLLTLGFAIVLTEEFDNYMFIGKPADVYLPNNDNKQRKTSLPKSNRDEEDDWHL